MSSIYHLFISLIKIKDQDNSFSDIPIVSSDKDFQTYPIVGSDKDYIWVYIQNPCVTSFVHVPQFLFFFLRDETKPYVATCNGEALALPKVNSFFIWIG